LPAPAQRAAQSTPGQNEHIFHNKTFMMMMMMKLLFMDIPTGDRERALGV
jgi:hypothetical protein